MSTRQWTLDPAHSGVHFAVRHMVVAKVRGTFDRWTLRLALDEDDLTRSSFEATLDATSINTRNEQRDNDLRSPLFLDAAAHPTLTFRSTKIERAGDGYRAIGDLTIRGVTREAVLEVDEAGFGKSPFGGDRAVFQARAVIDRKDFGLTWNRALETGGVLVGDKVEIAIDVEAIAQAAEAGVAA